MKTVRLKEGKERSLLRHHPWVFDSAVARGGGDAGETVRVEGHDGRFLAWASISPASRIRLRVWSFQETERIDADFMAHRVACAVAARGRMNIQSDGVRLVHGESDGLPGLIVDRYADTLVAQFLACGVERFKPAIVAALMAATGLDRVYERSDTNSRSLEGLPPSTGWLAGTGPTELVLSEHGWQLSLDIATGHKTGYYLDQRDNRARLAEAAQRLAPADILNAYCYSGGFTVAALAGLRSGGHRGHVVSIDSSAPALARAQLQMARNGLNPQDATWLDADVNASMRRFIEEGRQFDAIVLDPPKLAPTAAHAERAARAYKDINRLAFKLLREGGLLYTFSCSGGVSADLFHKIVASAGADAGVDGFILEKLTGAPDHPMTLAFPEGEYLKGLVVMRR